jgi:hypothetical protein
MKDDYERYGDICYLDICEKGQKICSFGWKKYDFEKKKFQ